MELSVIIVSHNSRAYLASCLQSLRERLSGIAHEICVVDNASNDDTAAFVRQQFPHVILIERDANTGFAAATNAGLAATRGRYVCWLNPDTRLLDDGVRALLDYFEANPATAVLGPQILNPDGTIQHSCRSFPSYVTAFFNRNSLLTRFFPRNRHTTRYLHSDWDHKTTQEVDWVSGACLFHRRSVTEALGGVDERFFMYMEDIDFCLRVRQAGHAIVYVPLTRVLHHIGGSSRRIPFISVLVLHQSIWRYYAKHFPRSYLRDAASLAIIGARCTAMLLGTALRGPSILDPEPAVDAEQLRATQE